MKHDNIIIGKIKSCHKWTGYLLVTLVSSDYLRFFALRYVLIDVFGDLRKFYIEELSYDKKDIYVKFLNFDNPDDIDFLIGKDIYINSSCKSVLSADEHLVSDLIGCSVYRGKNFVGKIINVLSFPANDVYVVENNQNKEILIPAVKKIIKKIDTIKKRLDLSEDFEFSDD
ncbi:MAG: 16S rRNA processing protein RimM [Ignavibacteriales bacterium]|nr:16S rRNA processing protein RimM [Ignavibacteriales bacterium]